MSCTCKIRGADHLVTLCGPQNPEKMSTQPEFSTSSERASPNSRSHLPVQYNNPTNPDDCVVNQQSGSFANAQPSPGSPSASSSRHKIDDVAAGPTVQSFSLSLTLQNTGSVARDHLASERTFLAYVRTSLSFASAGVGASPNTLLGAVALSSSYAQHSYSYSASL